MTRDFWHNKNYIHHSVVGCKDKYYLHLGKKIIATPALKGAKYHPQFSLFYLLYCIAPFRVGATNS